MLSNPHFDIHFMPQFLVQLDEARARFVPRDEKLIQGRKEYIDQNFVLTDDVYFRLNRLNNLLIEEEMRLYHQFVESYFTAMHKSKNFIIDHFQYEIGLQCFNVNYYSQYNPCYLDCENAFFETKFLTSFIDFQKNENNQFHDKYVIQNFTENHINIEFYSHPHCYTFHHLYHHTDLTWFDIYNIDEFSLNLHTKYQFSTNYIGQKNNSNLD